MAELHHTSVVSVRQFPTHIHPSLNSDAAVRDLLHAIRKRHTLYLEKACIVTEVLRKDLDPDAVLEGVDIRNLRFYERCFRAAQRLFALEVAISRFCREGGAA